MSEAGYKPSPTSIRSPPPPCYAGPSSPLLRLSNLVRDHHRYTADLLALEQASPAPIAAPGWQTTQSPLDPAMWQQHLRSYPDREFAHFIMRGLRGGFRIGVQRGAHLKSSTRNLKSAYQQPQVVQAYLDREVQLGRLHQLPCSDSARVEGLQISPFGVIPKRNKPNKWRLIVDLSTPDGASINDAISQELASISYTSVDDAVSMVGALGPGCLLAKLDLKEAYRAIPVHPADQGLLAVTWAGSIYIDRALPFGLRSVPKIFSAVTDAMMWILHERGVQHAMHYLDDFLILGPAESTTCQRDLTTTLTTCVNLGFPVAPEKTEGPTTRLTFLGIEIDSGASQIQFPQEKLVALQATISQWMNKAGSRSSCKKRDLLSLIGLLQHATAVVRPGRAFVRSLIDAASTVQHLDHWVHLNLMARSDIAWWHTFVQAWNGVSLMPFPQPSRYMTSDASAFHNLWFQAEWPPSWARVPIAPKELVPIVMAVALWGPQWAGEKVCCLCDNAAVVAVINKGSARDPALMCLIRLLTLLCAILNITVTAQHLPGAQNASVDALLRNKRFVFFHLNPQASPVPAIIPNELRELVFNRSLRWTSPDWMGLLSTTLIAALRLPHAQHTEQPIAVTQPSVGNSVSPIRTR